MTDDELREYFEDNEADTYISMCKDNPEEY